MKSCSGIDANSSSLGGGDSDRQLGLRTHLCPDSVRILSFCCLTLVLVLNPLLCLKLSAYRIIYSDMIYFLKMGFSIQRGEF